MEYFGIASLFKIQWEVLFGSLFGKKNVCTHQRKREIWHIGFPSL